MNKNDFLQPIVESVLIKIDFINRYESLSNTYSNRDATFLFSNNEILAIANSIGYALKYSKSREFHLHDNQGKFLFGFGFTLRYHSLEIGWSVKNELLQIHSVAPWGFWVSLLTNDEKKIKMPMFSDYE
jgi:hypothetical protein